MYNAFQQTLKTIVSFIILLVFSGCGTTTPYKAFDDASLLKDQYAVIDCKTKNQSEKEAKAHEKTPLIYFTEETPYYDAFILRVDGKLISMIGKAFVHVLPGKHSLQISCHKMYGPQESLSVFVDRWLVAEAGKTYYVIAKALEDNMYQVQVVIVDEKGALVGGVVGSDDEPDAPIEGAIK